MFKLANKRLAYLCFHVAGRDVELPILRRLGFEIFTMKRFDPAHRSAYSDNEYDKTLTIPDYVVSYLNTVNFVDSEWPDLAIHYLNKYFDYVFVIQASLPVYQSVARFNGHVLIRLAGLDLPKTYTNIWQMDNPDILPMIYRNQRHVWMSVQYENLCEVEDPIFTEQSLFMPLGIPSFFKRVAGSWRPEGAHRPIISVLPWLHSPYYAKKFDRAKFIVKHRNLRILGAQKMAYSDPRVVGFLDNDRYVAEFQNSAAMLYDSHEPRHVHYPPIEAAVIGLPVVFFRESLLGYLYKGFSPAAYDTVDEARDKLDRLIAGDIGFIREIQVSQQLLLQSFADEFVLDRWVESFERISSSERERIDCNSERVIEVTAEHLRRGVLVAKQSFDDTGLHWTTDPTQISEESGVSYGDGIVAEVRWLVSHNQDAMVGTFCTDREKISGSCVHEESEALPNGAFLIRQFWRFPAERLQFGWRGRIFSFNFHAMGVEPDRYVENLLLRMVSGQVELGNCISLDRANRPSVPFFCEGFAFDSEYSIDLLRDRGTIHFPYDTEDDTADAFLSLLIDNFSYKEQYNVKVSLNGKNFPIIRVKGQRQLIKLMVSDILRGMNCLEFEVLWSKECQLPANRRTLTLVSLEVLSRGIAAS